MADDTNHPETSDTTDLTPAISLLAFNNDSEPLDSTDLTAAISLLALNSSTQSTAIYQETRSNIPETSFPIKKCLDIQRYVPRPASRKLAPEACCFIRELSAMNADHDVGRLYLTRDEAKTIPSCPQMTEVPKNMRKIATLMVFDYKDVLWKMKLNCYKYGENILYLLSVDAWRNFLHAHDLGRGDTIFFYKNRDSRINGDDYYYVILFWRVIDGGFKTFLDLPCKKTSSQERKNRRDFRYREKSVKKCRKFR